MSFEIDNETYRDLGIFHGISGDSIFSIYDKTRTAGGTKLLFRMMQEPLSDQTLLQERIKACFAKNRPFLVSKIL